MGKLNYLSAVEIDGRSTGGSFYLYEPESPHSYDMLSSFMNGVIFVYPNEKIDSGYAAEELLEQTGLKEIAEQFPAYIVMPCPLHGELYNATDVELFCEIQYYLAGGSTSMGEHGPETIYPRRTTNTLLTVMAEGKGADFVHQILAHRGKRIAGVLTFGGSLEGETADGVPVPAYLVGASEEVVGYYSELNDCDCAEGNVLFDSDNPIKKVITVPGEDRFNREQIWEAWDNMLSGITRLGVSANLVFDLKNEDEWVLMSWPNLTKLPIRVDSFAFDPAEGTAMPLAKRRTENIQSVHVYMPDAVLKSAEPAPLVLVLHGHGDDPLNVTAGCGWIDKAVEENLILAAPADEEPDSVMALVEYLLANYPVDRRRIYCTGFSMGGMSTAKICKTHPDLFAAMAPMGAGGGDLCEGIAVEHGLPTCMIVGSADDLNFRENADGKRIVTGLIPGSVEQNFAINGIDPAAVADTDTPYWEKAPDLYTEVTDKGLVWQIGDFFRPDYPAPVVRTVTLIGAGHSNADYMATVAWEFMQPFARADDGTLICRE